MIRAKLVLMASFFMHLKVALSISVIAIAFILTATLGGKLSFDAGMTGLIGILTYWAMPPGSSGGLHGDRD